MKRIFRLIAIAILGLMFSFGIHTLSEVGAAQPFPNQNSGSSLVQRAKQYYDSGQFDQAEIDLKEAINIYQTKEAFVQEAQVLSLLSLTYQKLGKWQEAAETLDKAELTNLNPRVHAQILNAKGHLQLVRESPEKALETWKETEKLYAKAGVKEGVVGSQINQAQAMQELGFYPRACDTLFSTLDIDIKEIGAILEKEINEEWKQKQEELGQKQELEIKLNIKDCKSLTQLNEDQLLKFSNLLINIINEKPDSKLKIHTLHKLGNILLGIISDENLSTQILEKSKTIAQELNAIQDISSIYVSLGNANRVFAKRAETLKNLRAAKKFIEVALNNYQEAEATAILPIIRVQAQLNKLSLLIATKQWNKAANSWKPIVSLLARLNPSRDSIYAQVNLGNNLTCLKLKQKKPTCSFYQKIARQSTNQSDKNEPSWATIIELENKAIEQAKKIPNQRLQSYAIGNLGQLYEYKGEPQKALYYTEEALNLAQQIQAQDIAYQWQWQLGRLEKKNNKKKIALTAYAQAFNTLKSLRGELVALNPEIQYNFRDEIEPVYREYVDLLLQDKNPSQEDLKKARDVIEALQLAELNDYFRDVCLNVKEQQIDEIDSKAAVIYSIILPDRLAVILSLPGQNLRYYKKTLSQNKVERKVVEMRLSLRRRTSIKNEVLPVAQEVYEWLIRDAEEELSSNGVKTLVFVLDGVLRNLPMAVLYDGQKYLAQKYNIVLTPGLQLLESRSLKLEHLNILFAGLSEARQGFSALPGVEFELNQIESQLSSEKLQPFLNEQFTEINFQEEIDTASLDVIHLASHAQFSSNPEQTFILTWDDNINIKELEKLLKGRKFRNSPIELLILSACQTASGDKRAVLGLAGLAVRSGARSTLATLWTVNDQSTAEFMVEFYKELIQPEVTKVEAVHKAQLKLLQDPRYKHPYFWAPFVLVGNWL